MGPSQNLFCIKKNPLVLTTGYLNLLTWNLYDSTLPLADLPMSLFHHETTDSFHQERIRTLGGSGEVLKASYLLLPQPGQCLMCGHNSIRHQLHVDIGLSFPPHCSQ